MAASAYEWVTLPREIAERHPLYGIKGWMILIALSCAFSPLRAGALLVGQLRQDLNPTLSDITTASASEVGIIVLFAVWGLANLALIFKKHRAFPISYIASWVSVLGVGLVAILFVQPSDGMSAWDTGINPRVARLIGLLFWTGLFAGYVQSSVRVAVTFYHRVPATYQILRKAVAEIF